jgi:hypothetical protein
VTESAVTEQQWLSAKSIDSLRDWWQARPPRDRLPRKERLFACACCRLWWDQLTDVRCRRAVEAAEAFADGLIGKPALARARTAATAAARDTPRPPRGDYSLEASVQIVTNLHRDDVFVATTARLRDAAPDLRLCTKKHSKATQAALLRDILGNPFRKVTFSPSWRTDTAVALAKQMYEAREFSAMPILADALQDAGCDNEDVLDHCREPGLHVRGCWVVDLVLGNE